MCRYPESSDQKRNPGNRGGNGSNYFGHKNFNEVFLPPTARNNLVKEIPKVILPFKSKKKTFKRSSDKLP